MSDGPHRSLPMRRPWKRLAARADVPSYSPAEVAEALRSALVAGWSSEVTPSLLRRVGMLTEEGGLFVEQADRDLTLLRGTAAASPLAGLLIDCTRDALAEGLRGERATVFAVEAALPELALRGVR